MDLDTITPGNRIYFLGIGGTGMSSAAGLMKQAGFFVTGSDNNIYPPTSDILRDLEIPIFTPYDEKNISRSQADIFVVGNSISRGHPELEYILEKKLSFTSFPQLLKELILPERIPVVISGTHGKTTCSSLVSHCLHSLGEPCGFFIGGRAKNFSKNFSLGSSKIFILEGDEYDTSFDDKQSKFLHYSPKVCLLNNIEFDHADIFASLEEVETSFSSLLSQVDDPCCIVSNVDSPSVLKVLKNLDLFEKVTKISPSGFHQQSADIWLKSNSFCHYSQKECLEIGSNFWGDVTVQTKLLGSHNAANIIASMGVLGVLQKKQGILKGLDATHIADSIQSFKGVDKRLQLLPNKKDLPVYFDFAHHPSAVKAVLKTLKNLYPSRRLVAAFEPKNATSRRNILQKEYEGAFQFCDIALLASPQQDLRIPTKERMDISSLAGSIGEHSLSFSSHDDLLNWLLHHIVASDLLVFMSCGDFSGIHKKFIAKMM